DITPDVWTEITKSKAIRLAVNAEHERRMLNGTAAQESAAQIFTEAPEVLGSILRDDRASPRHRIEASKELRATAPTASTHPPSTTPHNHERAQTPSLTQTTAATPPKKESPSPTTRQSNHPRIPPMAKTNGEKTPHSSFADTDEPTPEKVKVKIDPAQLL